MAFVLADRVRETTSSVGTGAVALAGAVLGFDPFSVIGNGNTTYYGIIDATAGTWEVGVGTYNAAGNTLSRTTVLSSSSGGTPISFAAGVKDVICTQPASRAVEQSDIGTAPNEIPLNQFLGNLAYQDAANIAGDVGVGGDLTVDGVATLGNGAILGTPASGEVTNLTGTASININGTVGATTASTGAFTNLAYTGTLTGGTGVVNLGSGQLFKDANGNVGIGTSSPGSKLTIAEERAAIRTSLVLRTTGTAAAGDLNRILFQNINTLGNLGQGAAIGALLEGVGSNRNSLVFSVNGPVSTNEAMRIDSNGNVGIGTSSPNVGLARRGDGTQGMISAQGASNPYWLTTVGSFLDPIIAWNSTGALRFSTSTDSAAGGTVERMRITAAGNVGIGTSSPLASLQVKAVNPDVYITSDNTGQSDIFFGGTSNPTGGNIKYSDNTNFMSFRTNGSERLRITSAGNVGIGVTAPGDKLEIGGAGAGIILASPNGTRYRITVDNAGVLTSTAV